ncbi:MAG: DUF4831 family protein [Dysgonamonadaceae bacterium]|jgi:hypothetical protein|nr:DUF4831 family protein [Dysgonamonadaceae bacterium]
MKIKNRLLFVFTGIFIFFASLSFAQTQVVKISALKTNDYGVRYVLPKTVLKIDIEYSETKQKGGIYAKYASRYLGVSDADVIMEDGTYYTLEKVSVTEASVPNKEQSYLVTFKSKTTAPFVCLTEDGVICTINADYTPESIPVSPKTSSASPAESFVLSPQSVYTEEYLRAGSVSKMAEVAAKNIYKIRESRQDILTGEAENVPKDGEAMKIILRNLDAQETIWRELFTGSAETVKHTKQLIIEPVAETKKEILFRFSNYFGVVEVDNLSGEPVYWNLKDLKTVEIPEADPKKKEKEPQSIVYNIPGKVEIKIYTGKKKLYATTVNVTQFGTTQILGTSLFEDKKAPVRVYFYPTTGAIKQIRQ